MKTQPNVLLLIGGYLAFVISLLHLLIIIGGAEWYRFFGAGEGMATQAEQGSMMPALVTLGIALVFLVDVVFFMGEGHLVHQW